MRSLAFIALFISVSAFSDASLCGRYQASGTVYSHEGKLGLLVNQETANRTFIELSNPKLVADKLGNTLEVEVFLEGFCLKNCKGELVKISKVTSPFEELNPFQQNQQNRIADRRCPKDAE